MTWLEVARFVAQIPEVQSAARKLLASSPANKVRAAARLAFLVAASEVVWQSVEYSRGREARLRDPIEAYAEFAVRLGGMCAEAGHAAPDDGEWEWLKIWLDHRCKLDKANRAVKGGR